jgi:hypothetical protein
MVRKMIVAGAMLVLPVTVNAMTVAEFLAKANALKAKGMLAMMSSDLGVVKGEFKTATGNWRADVDAARAKGRTDLGCPPAKGQVKMDSDMVMADLAAVPPALQPRISVKTAFYDAMAKRFPCK